MTAQMIPVPLRSLSFSAGGRDSIDLSVLPPTIQGRIAHLSKITFNVSVTPTFSAGTITPASIQNLVANLAIFDGVRQLFNGSFPSLRAFEALEQGGLFAPEPDNLTTTNTFFFERVFNCGPRMFTAEEDFLMPAASFRGGRIDVSYAAALTSLGSGLTITACVATIQPVAWMVLQDEIRLPPFIERYEGPLNNNQPLSGEALYAFLGAAKTSAFGVYTAGDIANVSIYAAGFTTAPVVANALTRAYQDSMQTGPFSPVVGDPGSANDTGAKLPNGTAIQAAASYVQPLIWSPKGSRITKLSYWAQPALTVQWSGSLSNVYGLATRLLPRDAQRGQQYSALAEAALGVKVKGGKVRTDSKAPYTGPRAPYMPLKLEV